MATFPEACRETTTPYLDLWTRFVSWEVMNANGLMQDSYQLNSAGVWMRGEWVRTAMDSLSAGPRLSVASNCASET